MKLSKGLSIKLEKEGDVLDKVTIGCSWGESGHSADIDAMVFFTTPEKLWDFVYYGNKDSKRKHCKHFGDDTTGQNKQHESDNEVILVNLSELPDNVEKIYVILNAYTGEKLSKIPSLKCRIYSGEPGNAQEILGTFDIQEHSKINTTTVNVGEFTKVNKEWVFIPKGDEIKAHKIDQLDYYFHNLFKEEGATVSRPERSEGFISKIIKMFKS